MVTYSYKGVDYKFVNAEKHVLDEVKCPLCGSDPL